MNGQNATVPGTVGLSGVATTSRATREDGERVSDESCDDRHEERRGKFRCDGSG